MKSTLRIIIFLAVALPACVSNENHRFQLDDIREVLFRYQIAWQHDGVCFLDLGEKGSDPSDKFMERFAGHNPPVRKASASRIIRATGRPMDKDTGVTGTIYSITRLKWISDTEVVAEGGCYVANLDATYVKYTLKKDNGKWKVIKEELIAIS